MMISYATDRRGRSCGPRAGASVHSEASATPAGGGQHPQRPTSATFPLVRPRLSSDNQQRSNMAKINKENAVNDHRPWKPEDDQMLADLIKRHVLKQQIAAVLGRTKRAIGERISTHHPDLWRTSDHPERAEEKAPHLAPGGKSRPDREVLERIERKVDRALAMLQVFMVEVLGDKRAEELRPTDSRPNGRTHE